MRETFDADSVEITINGETIKHPEKDFFTAIKEEGFAIRPKNIWGLRAHLPYLARARRRPKTEKIERRRKHAEKVKARRK